MASKPKAPFKILEAVVCDDIRQEKSNKFILIGVYLHQIIVGSLPAVVVISIWIHFLPIEHGTVKAKLRAMHKKRLLVEGDFEIKIPDAKSSVMAVPKIPLELLEPGTLIFQIDTGTGWKTIKEMEVSLREGQDLAAPSPSA